MSLYSDYLNETGQRHIVETDKGFATYQIDGSECYIVDIYIAPEARRTGLCHKIVNQVIDKAKEQGCRVLTGSVNTSIKTPGISVKVLLGHGLRFLREDPGIIWFYREI